MMYLIPKTEDTILLSLKSPRRNDSVVTNFPKTDAMLPFIKMHESVFCSVDYICIRTLIVNTYT